MGFRADTKATIEKKRKTAHLMFKTVLRDEQLR
jgi:hypothetical protein